MKRNNNILLITIIKIKFSNYEKIIINQSQII